MAKVENQNTDTGVVSIISVKATSELKANCRAYNEFGEVDASHIIKACEFLFSDYMIFSTVYLFMNTVTTFEKTRFTYLCHTLTLVHAFVIMDKQLQFFYRIEMLKIYF